MTNLSGANLNNGAAAGPQGEGMDNPSSFPAYPTYKDSWRNASSQLKRWLRLMIC